jgi:chaperonin GroES
MQLTTKLSLDELTRSINIAEQLTEHECNDIARWVIDGYEADKTSRKEWEERNAEALKLALQVRERKTEPWEGCSNVKFPLVTMAALYYHARAYPLLVNENDLVKCKVYGADPKGEKAARAVRVSEHMTWQNIEQMDEWESEHDKALLVQAILGVAVKKRWFDPVRRRQRTCVLGPNDFVVNYYTRGDINEAPRATHVMELQPNDVQERVVRGVYCDDYDERTESEGDDRLGMPEENQALPRTNELTQVAEERTGIRKPPLDNTAPVTMLEQACWLDLDGDEYEEPYFITVEQETGRLRRIVARYTASDIQRRASAVVGIRPERCYTKYGLIPAPDGSWYDIGFGHLLGPINASVDTALNQMFDAGTMSTVGGGFLGRGARLKAGDQRFRPYEWKTVDSIGDDLRKNIVALDIKEPSAVLFQLMMFLVQYAERTASANEIQTGENPGQNTPAYTTRVMNQNGARIFAAIYKRTWRSMRDEFRIQFSLNNAYLQGDEAYDDVVNGTGGIVTVQDYRLSPPFICPAADPNVISDEERIARAQQDMQLALQVPGFNRYKTIRRYLEAKRTPAIDDIFPRPASQQGPNGQPVEGDLPVPPDPKLLTVQVKQQELQLKAQDVQMKIRATIIQLQQAAQKLGAEILELRARSVMELAQAKSVDQGQQIALIDAMIGAKKANMDATTALIESMTNHLLTMRDINGTDASGAGGGSDQPSSDGSGASGNGQGGMAGASDNAGVFSLAANGDSGASGGVGGGGVH